MTRSINEALDLRSDVPTEFSGIRVSKLAKCALGFSVVSGFCGFLSLGTGPIRSGWLLPEIPDWLFCAVFLSVASGGVAILLSIAGTIRIRCARGRVRGYALCGWGAGLALLGTVIWVVAVGRALL